jgi:predicted Zn-dependent protease
MSSHFYFFTIENFHPMGWLWKFYTDAGQQERLAKIAEKFVRVLPEPIPVRIYLIKNDTVNACCLPGGIIIFHSGTMQQITNDDELAAIFAHEFGHMVARHGAEGMTKMLMQTAGKVYATEKFAGENASAVKLSCIKVAYGLGSNVGFRFPYNRVGENEADRLSVIYLKRAGFDPNGALRLMTFFLSQENKQAKAWKNYFSTHPATEKRVERIRAAIAELATEESAK